MTYNSNHRNFLMGLIILAAAPLSCVAKTSGSTDASLPLDANASTDASNQECAPGDVQACECLGGLGGAGIQGCAEGSWVTCACLPDCGNGACGAEEDETSCPQDCAVPTTCVPDERFCDGGLLRLCTADGSTSTLVHDCSALAAMYNNYFSTCGACPGYWNATCVAPSPACDGAVTGPHPRTVLTSHSGNSCTGIDGCTTSYQHAPGWHALSFSHTGDDFTFSFLSYSFASVASGVATQLNSLVSGDVAPFSVSVTSGGVTCTNKQNYCPSCVAQPPGEGTVLATFTSLDLGDQYTIDIDGHLTCDDGAAWEAFTANYTARVTQVY